MYKPGLGILILNWAMYIAKFNEIYLKIIIDKYVFENDNIRIETYNLQLVVKFKYLGVTFNS